jgi:ABC-2 type transport system ATP-binding protein
MSTAISVTGLRKSYGDHLVLDGIDLTVPAGSVYALLGRTARARPPPCRSSPR